jgi:3-dehydrosphinganine reductase
MKIKAKLEPGKVAVVTGGSSGIGKAIACGLAERGTHVWLVAQRKDILGTARSEVEAHRINPDQKIYAVSSDVSDLDQVRKSVAQIMEASGTPDLLVNSAGVTYPGYVEKLELNIFYWMMEVNYYGTVYMTKEVLPAMIARGSGYILNICSLSGIISTFGYTAYGASKYAVHGFSEALRMEMKVHGIGVSIIFPTDTDTPQLAYENQFKPAETRALNSAGGMNTPEAIARSAIIGIEHGQYKIIPNLDAKLIRLLNSLSPSLVNYIVDMIVANAVKKKTAQEGKKE